MNPFTYVRAVDAADALQHGGVLNAKYLGGGTNLVDLMRETIERPAALVDVTSLPSEITESKMAACLMGSTAFTQSWELPRHAWQLIHQTCVWH